MWSLEHWGHLFVCVFACLGFVGAVIVSCGRCVFLLGVGVFADLVTLLGWSDNEREKVCLIVCMCAYAFVGGWAGVEDGTTYSDSRRRPTKGRHKERVKWETT